MKRIEEEHDAEQNQYERADWSAAAKSVLGYQARPFFYRLAQLTLAGRVIGLKRHVEIKGGGQDAKNRSTGAFAVADRG